VSGLVGALLDRYRPLVNYWLSRINTEGRVYVALQIYRSPESAHDRVEQLHKTLLGRSPATAGWNYWANRVVTDGDLTLATNLASSDEYCGRASTRFAGT
jgi:hypothetical protein